MTNISNPTINNTNIEAVERITEPRRHEIQFTAYLRTEALLVAAQAVAQQVRTAHLDAAIAAFVQLSAINDDAFKMSHADERICISVGDKIDKLTNEAREALLDRLPAAYIYERPGVSPSDPRTVVVINMDHVPIFAIERGLALGGQFTANTNELVFTEADETRSASQAPYPVAVLGADPMIMRGPFSIEPYVCSQLDAGLSHAHAYSRAVEVSRDVAGRR